MLSLSRACEILTYRPGARSSTVASIYGHAGKLSEIANAVASEITEFDVPVDQWIQIEVSGSVRDRVFTNGCRNAGR